MSQTVCTQCGTELSGEERFCPKCGHVVEKETQAQVAAAPKTEMQAQVTAAPEMKTADVSPTVTEQPASGRRGKKLTPLSVVLSILICLVLILLGIGASLTGIVKMSLGETAIETAVGNVELAELKTGQLSGSGQKNETLPQMIYDSIEPGFKEYMPEEEEALEAIEEILEEDFVKDFLAEKTQDYVSDILTGSGDGRIKVKEVTDLIRKNRKKLEDLTQGKYRISDSDIEDVREYLEQNHVLEDLDLSELQDENETAFDLVQNLFSYWMLGLLAGLFVLFVVLLFLANRRFRRSMVYLGISLLLVGAADVTLAIMTGRISGLLNDMLRLGEKFYGALLSPVRTNSFIVGGCTLLVGLLALILPQVFRKKRPAAGR